MLRTRTLMAMAVLSTATAAGCANNYTCADYATCPYEGGARDGGSDARTDGPVKHHDGAVDARSDHHVTDAGGDGDGGACAPTQGPSVAGCISNAYAVFVAPAANGGSSAGPGTMASPFATIGQALAGVGTHTRVFVCAATYDEKLTVGSTVDGVQVFGGLACPASAGSDASADGGAAAWAFTGGHAVVAPTTTGVVLTLTGLTTGVHFENFEFDAANGVNPGDSSIAVFASNAGPSSFTGVTMTGGNGVTGATGMAGSNYSGAQASAGNPASGALQGPTLTCTCGDGSTSTGGHGGSGDSSAPGSGAAGAPVISGAPATDGAPGVYGVPNAGQCSNGIDGASSASVGGGTGATSAGALTASGWTVGPAGAAGSTAGPAQGGGGGAGGTYSGSPSGGGGSGGCGGCGGAGANGGGTGGSSFALLSIGSSLTLNACTLTAGTAGAGGLGGTGQSGEPGGAHGNGAGNGCPGGGGGTGGSGGGGGGGAGGLSVAIGYSGTQPQTSNGTTTAVASTPAAGGMPGGLGTPPATHGATGVVEAVLALTGDAG